MLAEISLSERGLPCGPPNKSSAVCMCRLARIAAMMPSTRCGLRPCWDFSIFAFCSHSSGTIHSQAASAGDKIMLHFSPSAFSRLDFWGGVIDLAGLTVLLSYDVRFLNPVLIIVTRVRHIQRIKTLTTTLLQKINSF